MTPKDHAQVFRRAACIVGAMDPIAAAAAAALQQAAFQGGGAQFLGSAMSSEELAQGRAYSAAARVLLTIAAEYEKAATSSG